MFANFVVSLYGMAFVYCIVMVLWTGSVVSLLYEAIYSSVSCARSRRELESLFVLYDCLLQIRIVEFPTLSCAKFGSLTIPFSPTGSEQKFDGT